ncbi:MAG: hypothetical protein ACK5OX_05745, partial [Desertimonas sp.]
AGMAITVPLTEFSYRFIETPIRTGHLGRWWRRLGARRDPTPRRVIAVVGSVLVGFSLFGAASLATAELKPNDVQQQIAANEGKGIDIDDLIGDQSPSTGSVAGDETGSSEPAAETTGPVAGPSDGSTSATAATTSTSTTTTTLPPTTTTTPIPPGGTLAIGDSVMLGALGELNERGILADAVKNRQMRDMIPTLQALRDNGTLENLGALVVHLGTNGPVSEETLDEFFSLTDQVPLVIVMTVYANRNWTAGNNALLNTLPAKFPNVELGFWDGVAPACQGGCFARDNIHLTATGAEYYANFVRDWLTVYKTERGLPTD